MLETKNVHGEFEEYQVQGTRFDYMPVRDDDWVCDKERRGCLSQSKALWCTFEQCYEIDEEERGLDDVTNLLPRPEQGKLHERVPETYQPKDWECAKDKCYSNFREMNCFTDTAGCQVNGVSIGKTRQEVVQLDDIKWNCDAEKCISRQLGYKCYEDDCWLNTELHKWDDDTKWEHLPGKTRFTEVPITDDWHCENDGCWSVGRATWCSQHNCWQKLHLEDGSEEENWPEVPGSMYTEVPEAKYTNDWDCDTDQTGCWSHSKKVWCDYEACYDYNPQTDSYTKTFGDRESRVPESGSGYISACRSVQRIALSILDSNYEPAPANVHPGDELIFRITPTSPWADPQVAIQAVVPMVNDIKIAEHMFQTDTQMQAGTVHPADFHYTVPQATNGTEMKVIGLLKTTCTDSDFQHREYEDFWDTFWGEVAGDHVDYLDKRSIGNKISSDYAALQSMQKMHQLKKRQSGGNTGGYGDEYVEDGYLFKMTTVDGVFPNFMGQMVKRV